MCAPHSQPCAEQGSIDALNYDINMDFGPWSAYSENFFFSKLPIA